MALKLEYMKDELIEMYQSGKSISKIAKEIGEYPQSVSNLLKEYNVFEPEKYSTVHSIDDSFFSKIDTEVKAYYLGFIAADGALVQNKIASSHQLTISIKADDIQVLEGLKEAMKATHPIQTLAKNQVRFAVMRKQITEDLMKLGVTPNKSLTLQPMLHHLPEGMKNHFIRGYFDGNGSVFETRTGRKDPQTGLYDHLQHYVSIRSTEDFLKDIQSYMGLGGTIQFNTGTHQWRIGAKADVIKFRDMIYSDAHVYLDRKREKFPW